MKDLSPYKISLAIHLDECEQDLAELKVILSERPWRRIERLAAERTLQVLLEGCIGVAKNLAKQKIGFTSPEPRKAFAALLDHGLIDSSVPWAKTVGLRNALVHDYLDVDDSIVRSVIEQGYYLPLLAFARQGLCDLS